MLWKKWFEWVGELKGACSRRRTFLWLGVALIGFTVRDDLLGVTSFIRCIGLAEGCYPRLLAFFHSTALNTDRLARVWTAAVLARHPGILRHRGHPVLVAAGLKNPKSGRRMPGVKVLHQESESNSKPEYITGHSCQAASLLVRGLTSVAAIPLIARIHEGIVFSNRDKRTLLDKMVDMLNILNIGQYILVADAYYASRKIILPLLRQGCQLISRVRSNAVAYMSPAPGHEGKRGRKKVYGQKVPLSSMFDNPSGMTEAAVDMYGDSNVQIRYRTLDLLWRPIGMLVRFVAVVHPVRGKCILMCTDLTTEALEIIAVYSFRFKIEIGFKQAKHIIGAYIYHFWMAGMEKLPRRPKNQHMHHKTEEYRRLVRRKLDAYNRFIQVGLVAQGIMIALATTVPEMVWASFNSWLRTVRPGTCPSERVVAMAMKGGFQEFLWGTESAGNLTKFIRKRCAPGRWIADKKAA